MNDMQTEILTRDMYEHQYLQNMNKTTRNMTLLAATEWHLPGKDVRLEVTIMPVEEYTTEIFCMVEKSFWGLPVDKVYLRHILERPIYLPLIVRYVNWIEDIREHHREHPKHLLLPSNYILQEDYIMKYFGEQK